MTAQDKKELAHIEWIVQMGITDAIRLHSKDKKALEKAVQAEYEAYVEYEEIIDNRHYITSARDYATKLGIRGYE